MLRADSIARLARAAFAALFLLAVFASPLQMTLPSSTGDGHQHLLAHDASAESSDSHHLDGVEAPGDPAPDADGADHSHPAHSGLAVAAGLGLAQPISNALTHDPLPARADSSRSTSPPHRPPAPLTISA